MKLRPQPDQHNPLFDPFDGWEAWFERASFIDSLRHGARPEFCGPHLSFERAAIIGRFGRAESKEEEVEVLDLHAQEEADRAIVEEILEKYRLFANLAASLKLDLEEELVARAHESALCSEQISLKSHAAAAPAVDHQAERLGLATLCLTPRLLAQRPIAARVARAHA